MQLRQSGPICRFAGRSGLDHGSDRHQGQFVIFAQIDADAVGQGETLHLGQTKLQGLFWQQIGMRDQVGPTAGRDQERKAQPHQPEPHAQDPFRSRVATVRLAVRNVLRANSMISAALTEAI
jgi:hypothetical protein